MISPVENTNRVLRPSGAMLLVLALSAALGGCRHTPSYNDIKVDSHGSTANSNAARPEPSFEPANPIGIPGAAPSPEASANPTATPNFLDPKTGRIRDLPLYPGAKPMGVQYGPIGGITQITLQAVTRAPFENVTAFYDKVVKDNGWTIDDNSRDTNSYTWQLSRGRSEHGAIRVDREQDRVNISLARTN